MKDAGLEEVEELVEQFCTSLEESWESNVRREGKSSNKKVS